MPDVRNRWHYHARWNQSDQLWQDDIRQLADCGFDLIRWQTPWSMVEPEKGRYQWDLIDTRVEYAARLGVEIFYPIVHFNLPSWLAGKGVRHSVFASDLPQHVAEYTDKLMSRYRFRHVVPVVEVQMDAFQRGWLGNWQPHQKSRTSYRLIYNNLLKAFRASSAVARSYGATVFCSEPASEAQTVVDLGDAVDIAGIDLYPHMHKQWSIEGYLRHWHKVTGKPLCISEFGTPETYNPQTKVDEYNKFVPAGVDRNRVIQCRQMAEAMKTVCSEGVQIPFGGWYPGTGNIGWGFSLTKERKAADCDRAGLVDLSRQPDGRLERVVCRDLVREVLALKSIGEAPDHAAVQFTPALHSWQMPMPPLAAGISAAGD